MWSMLKQLMAQGDDDGGSGIGRFLPFIILMVLYGLSSLFGKKKKPPQQQRPQPRATDTPQSQKPPAPQPQQRPSRLPSYARKRSQQETTSRPRPVAQQPQSRPTAQPRPSQPAPQRRPVPAKPTPARPQRPRPVSSTPAPIKPKPQATQPAPRRSAQARPAGQTQRHIQAEKKPRAAEHHVAPKPKKSARTAARAMHAQHEHTLNPKPVPVKTNSSLQQLVQRTQMKGPLAQAILYGEILGTPMALRPSGSHSYTALGTPGISR